MKEQKSVNMHRNVLEGLRMKFPKDFSFNDIVEEISSPTNIRSRKLYRDEDILFAIEQIEGFRKEIPGISIQEIIEMIKKQHERGGK